MEKLIEIERHLDQAVSVSHYDIATGVYHGLNDAIDYLNFARGKLDALPDTYQIRFLRERLERHEAELANIYADERWYAQAG